MTGWMRALLWLTVVLAVVAGVLRYFFVDFYTVPDQPLDPHAWSNAPNLEPGDVALVWRGGEAHVGDLVRCTDPSDPAHWLVARVVGTGGDRVELGDGVLRINGFHVTTGACSSMPRNVIDPTGMPQELLCAGEDLGGSRHDVLYPKKGETFAVTRVAAEKLFLLSDNRATPWSHDSRIPEIGQMPAEACKQRLLLRLWSKKGWGDAERRISWLF